MQVLIAEDEPRIASFIEKGLQGQGFTTTVASSAQDTIALALSGLYDLLLLDLGLPGKDGLEILADLRGQGATLPIIILTARDDLQDKLSGLEGGADDYMTKPFRFEELLARIRLRLRSGDRLTATPIENSLLTAQDVVLDLNSRRAKVHQQWLELPAREFILAETFFRHPNQVLTRQQLLDRVWGTIMIRVLISWMFMSGICEKSSETL